jgi:hypothetical protein
MDSLFRDKKSFLFATFHSAHKDGIQFCLYEMKYIDKHIIKPLSFKTHSAWQNVMKLGFNPTYNSIVYRPIHDSTEREVYTGITYRDYFLQNDINSYNIPILEFSSLSLPPSEAFDVSTTFLGNLSLYKQHIEMVENRYTCPRGKWACISNWISYYKCIKDQAFIPANHAAWNYTLDLKNSKGGKNELIKKAIENGDVCPITCAPLERRKALVLECEHIFDRSSITRWLNDHTTCPVCRANAVIMK